MNKVAHYLQEHLTGEVMTSGDVRDYFSTDTSVFRLAPAIVVYPRNENDVRKTARFAWQLAERGRVIPLTARGAGTDQSGAALGAGIMLVFPAHMNRILELDGKAGTVTIEPGTNFGKLQQTLFTHNRFLPPYPASLEYSTIGGAIGNNASGERSVKYGNMREYVKALRAVLANGEVIETRRLSRRELHKKLGLSNYEGEVYRSLDTMIEENQALLKNNPLAVSKNSAGYALNEVKRKDGSFDLTPLIVGSQGTLAIVTEATVETEAHNPHTTLILAMFSDLQAVQQAVLEMRKSSELPCAIEMIDEHLLNFLHRYNPNQLKGLFDPPFSKAVLLIEFDNQLDRVQKKLTRKTVKILQKAGAHYRIETDAVKRDELWRIRHAAASVISHTDGTTKALPLIEDGVVPLERFREYLVKVYELFERYGLTVALWGHAGDANLHMQPFMDLNQVGDRQKIFRIIEDYYQMIIDLGGSTSGEHGDGRLRGPYLQKLYGQEWYDLFVKTKQIFDPFNILNPGVKIGVTLDDIKPLLRNEYSLKHLYDHLPHS